MSTGETVGETVGGCLILLVVAGLVVGGCTAVLMYSSADPESPTAAPRSRATAQPRATPSARPRPVTPWF